MGKGERLKQLRDRSGLSQVDAADKIGVSKQTLYKYEQDIITNIPSDVIERIAKVYNTTPSHIMGWDDNANVFPGIKTDLSGIDPKEIDDAIDLYERFENLSPEKQAAFLNYLMFLQSDS